MLLGADWVGVALGWLPVLVRPPLLGVSVDAAVVASLGLLVMDTADGVGDR